MCGWSWASQGQYKRDKGSRVMSVLRLDVTLSGRDWGADGTGSVFGEDLWGFQSRVRGWDCASGTPVMKQLQVSWLEC